jgi:uncharacterized membrane protein (UPF0127 family)
LKIINKTKNAVLAEEAIMADRLFPRIKGLLGRKNFRQGEAIIITPCNSIHTFFMGFPIDVLFVNKNNLVVKAISAMPPGRLTPIYFNACFVIELPPGTIQSTSTSKGDTLLIE